MTRAPQPSADGRYARRAVAGPEGDVGEVTVDLAESPLAWLRSRRDRAGAPLIDDDEFEAGERLRSDFERGGMSPRIGMNWDALGGPVERRGSGPGSGLSVADAAIAARERLAAALGAVGPDLAAVLVDVCCRFHGLADVEQRHGWPARSGKVVLRLGLAALARHYRIGEPARGPERGRTRHWGAPDYKPSGKTG